MTQDVPDSVRAAEFVLGVLSPEDRLAFSGRMMLDPALRAKATFWSEHFAYFGAQATPVTPPDGVFEDISTVLFGPRDPAAATAQWTRRAAGAVLIGACGWTLAAPHVVRDNPRDNDLLATLRTENGRIVANAAFDPDTSRIYVQRVLGAAAQQGNYQIWLIADGGAPVSLGMLPDTDQVRFRIARAQRGLMVRSVLAISQEAEGSDARIAPKGPVVAIAPLAPRLG